MEYLASQNEDEILGARDLHTEVKWDDGVCLELDRKRGRILQITAGLAAPDPNREGIKFQVNADKKLNGNGATHRPAHAPKGKKPARLAHKVH